MEQESQILEINLISAQGLKPPSTHIGRFQTYAVLWVDSSEKLRTRVDNLGGGNPTWNDKFLFRVAPDFISGDTSGVSVDIFSVGHFRDSLVGSVRFLLGNCLGKDSVVNGVKGTPAFTAVLIQRQSGRFEGVLNVAMAFYSSEDFQLMSGLNAVCFRDLMCGEKRRRRLSRIGSRRSQKWSGGDSCDFDMLGSFDVSDGAESTTSSSSSASTILKDCNGLRGGKEGVKCNGGGVCFVD
ncbi:hypothetical protein Leryth_027275 [Lithospermum erythrorhizon]|nr:hypothetical protein Leryth_027275 [Lithospermum erythrorhizon]